MDSRIVCNKRNVPGIILILLLSVFTQNALAGVSGWTGYAHVQEVMPTIHGRFEANLALAENVSGCRNKTWIYQDYNLGGADKMFYVLLEALLADKKVRVFVTGQCDLNGYSEISSVAIVP